MFFFKEFCEKLLNVLKELIKRIKNWLRVFTIFKLFNFLDVFIKHLDKSNIYIKFYNYNMNKIKIEFYRLNKKVSFFNDLKKVLLLRNILLIYIWSRILHYKTSIYKSSIYFFI